MKIPLLPMLGVVALALAGCARISPQEATIMIRGELTYRERIALPPDAEARVMVRQYNAGGPEVIAEQRIELDGRQVPIAFQLEIDRNAVDPAGAQVLRALIVQGGYARRATEPRLLDLSAGSVETGSLQLRPLDRIAFGTAYRCGEVPVRFGTLDDSPRMVVDGQTFEMAPAEAGDGRRYAARDDESTWIEFDEGRIAVRANGRLLPACIEADAAGFPFTARGNEPGWHANIDSETLALTTGYGESTLRLRLLQRESEGDATRFLAAGDAGAALVSATARICRDSATGMPHPYAVAVQTRTEAFSGCGGDPSSLLVGREWMVEDIGQGGIVDRSRVTMEFDPEGRVAGSASCNRYTCSFQLTGEGLSIGRPASTKMACGEALMNQERRFLEILETVNRFDLDVSGTLVLTGANGSIRAR